MFSKRKRKSKKDEGTSNPPYSPAKKSKKTENSRRILRSTNTKDVEVQKRITIEAAIATKDVKAAEDARAVKASKVSKVDKLDKNSKVSKVLTTADV